MNKFISQLFKQFTHIDVDTLQADLHKMQNENTSISTQLKYTLQDIADMERRVELLEKTWETLSVNASSEKQKESKLPPMLAEVVPLTEKELETIDNKSLIKHLRRRITLLHQQIAYLERVQKEMSIAPSEPPMKEEPLPTVVEEELMEASPSVLPIVEKEAEAEEKPIEVAETVIPNQEFDVSPIAEALFATEEMTAEEPATTSEETTEVKGFSIEKLSPEEVQTRFYQLKERYPYIKVSTREEGQILFASTTIEVLQQLFEWGLNGVDCVSGEERFIASEDILWVRGTDKMYVGEKIICRFDGEDSNIEEVTQALLFSMIAYRPLRISYRSQNGTVVETMVYHHCTKPDADTFTLPYPQMFDEMHEKLPTFTQIVGNNTQGKAPKLYSIAHLQSVEVVDTFYTNKQGLAIRKEAIEKARTQGMDDLLNLLVETTPKVYRE